MGWLFSDLTLDEWISQLTATDDSENSRRETLDSTLTDDNVLWSVVRLTAKQAGASRGLDAGESRCYIHCDLMEFSQGQWGNKPLEESMHPYYYTCPSRYLDMAPEQCPEWRETVRWHHALRSLAA
jgi:hypothetical protein